MNDISTQTEAKQSSAMTPSKPRYIEDPTHVAKQGVRYLIVGFSSAGIELVMFGLLHLILGWNIPVANVISVVTSTLFNFLMSRAWTFQGSSDIARSILLYLVLFAFNTTFSTTVISLLANAGMLPIIAKVLTMGCITLWNFVLYRKVIFK